MAVWFGGVEGGGTLSTAILLNESAEIVARVEGSCTNHYLVGLDECVATIIGMIKQAFIAANKTQMRLKTLGLSLSGIENEQIKEVMERRIREVAPDLADSYYLCSDVFGSVATASKTGGVCVIAGTGSNCLAINPDGTFVTCGGWGHVLGDHGSAYDLTIRALRKIFAVKEGFVSPEEEVPDVTYLYKEMMEYFKLVSLRDMLDHAYTNFNKSFVAGFAKNIAAGADAGDSFCRALLNETGRLLGMHVLAVLPSLAPSLLADKSGLAVVCVGSVWLSYNHLQEGFLSIMKSPQAKVPNGLRLVRLTETAALGAAALAVRYRNNAELPLKYDQNVEQFFSWDGVS